MCYFLLQNTLEVMRSQNREQKIGLMQLNMSIPKQVPHILKKGRFFCRSHEVVMWKMCLSQNGEWKHLTCDTFSSNWLLRAWCSRCHEVLPHRITCQKLSGSFLSFGSTVLALTRGCSHVYGARLSSIAPITHLHCLRLAIMTASAVVAVEVNLAKCRTSTSMLLGLTYFHSLEGRSFHNCVLSTFWKYCLNFVPTSAYNVLHVAGECHL